MTMSREKAIKRIIEAEFHTMSITYVEFLSRRFKEGLGWKAAVKALVDFNDEIGEKQSVACAKQKFALLAALKRVRALERLTDSDFQSVVRETENQILLLKDKHLFHAPAMAADFDHYGRLTYWNMHEAACLLLGKDPRRLEPAVILNAPSGSPFVTQFRELTEILTRAVEAELIGNPHGDKWRIDPPRLVPWALAIGVQVLEPLATMYSQPDTGLYQGRNDELQLIIRKLENELRTQKAANSRERNTTLMIMRGLLHANLRAKPQEERASAKEVVDFVVEATGRAFDENTVRKRFTDIDKIVRERQSS